MEVHPGPEKRRVSEVKFAELDPIRRALQENEDWFQDLVEHSQDLLCIHDLEGRLLLVNPAPARALGYSVEEILQIPMQELVAPEFRPQFDAYLRQIERAGEARGFLAVMTRSGERRIWEYHNTLRTEGVASPIVRGLAHDITEQKRAERLAREATESLLHQVREGERTIRELKLFRTLVDQSNDAIEVVDPETLRFLDVNERACLELGYSREELLSLRVFDIDPAVTESSAAKVIERLRESGSVVMESVHRRKDRITFPVEVSLRRVHLERDYVVAVARDLTERKLAEARLRGSQDRYRAVHDRAPIGICWIETQTGRFLEVNPKYCEITGRTEQDLLSRDFQSITHPDDLVENCEKLRQLAEGKVRHYGMEKRYLRPDGSMRWVEVEVVTMGPEGEKPGWHMAIVQDISERRRAEERLREYEKVVEGLEEMIVVVDREYRYVIANRALLSYMGLEREQLIGRSVPEIAAVETLELVKHKMDECFQGKVVEYELMQKSARLGERDLLVSYFPIEGAAGVDRIAAVVRDITERKRAEARLREYEKVVEGVEDMIVVVDRDYRYIIANRAFLQYRDLKREQVVGHFAEEIVDKGVLDKVVRPRADECFQGKVVQYQTRYTYPKLGERDVWLTYFPIEGPTGVERIVSVMRDITEKVKAEEARKQAEESLRQNVAQLQAVTEELRVAKEKLAEEKLYLEETIDTELGFGEIIGRSSALKGVMQKVAKVAPSDATALLLGETGTGKELVARAIHRMSRREGRSFIKLNCAAIPSGLLESELFGHEKGAFTGAIARKLGRLELADKGTLFLDEIGEIPLSLQPKLLRVLQDMEFERLGGTQTLKVDFRLLAATNRDLLQSVKAREFRSDLFYRLNVFPILIPPLRERREDIRPLVEHFVRKFANQMKKSITSIPSKTMEMLVRWEWPGNIRELENFVERSVILSPGSVLQAPLSELQKAVEEGNGGRSVKLRDKERERILQVLRECHGKLGGPDGAAARLGLKRTTLQSKLDQLGIKPGAYRE
jgi:formate hydrogenlyase transcriptional activator